MKLILNKNSVLKNIDFRWLLIFSFISIFIFFNFTNYWITYCNYLQLPCLVVPFGDLMCITRGCDFFKFHNYNILILQMRCL